MRRVSLVSLVAAAVVVGHFAYHLLPRIAHAPGLTQAPAHLAPAAAPTPVDFASTPLVVPVCKLQPPLTEADRKPMLDALRPLVARDEQRDPDFAWEYRYFIRSFETCGVDVRERPDHVLVATPLGGMWVGARFRKTRHGWIALGLDGGDIR